MLRWPGNFLHSLALFMAAGAGNLAYTSGATRALLGAGIGGQTLVFNIDARGATMHPSEFEAIVHRVLRQTAVSSDHRRRTR